MEAKVVWGAVCPYYCWGQLVFGLGTKVGDTATGLYNTGQPYLV